MQFLDDLFVGKLLMETQVNVNPMGLLLNLCFSDFLYES